MAFKRWKKSRSKRPPTKLWTPEELKVKFQNLGQNGAESYFTWEPRSGSFVPNEPVVEDGGPMPWEA